MARVPRNKGNYQERKNGNWQVKFPLGWSDEKKKYDEYREEVNDEAEAISLIKSLNDYIYHGGKAIDIPQWRKGIEDDEQASSLTVSEFIDEFISNREKQKVVQARTIESYRDCFSRIEPYIGMLSLAALNPRDIDAAYAHMKSEGSDNVAGHVYSGTTLQKTHAFLSMALDKAVDYGFIARNPMTQVDRPKRDTPEKQALTAEQAQGLFAQIKSEPLAAEPIGIILCLGCGLRISEALSLQWVDVEEGMVSVTKSLQKDRQAYKTTKTNEERYFPCPSPVMEILEDWKSEQQTWFESNNLEWTEKAPIVNSSVGTHILQGKYNKWFAQSREHYSLPDGFTPHGLRHTFITLMHRDCHVDARTTRSISGHKTEQAFAIYKHTSDEWQQQATQQYGRLLMPDDDTARCQNCKYWSASPTDATKGCCWADEKKSGIMITNTIDKCSIDKFSLKASA